MAEQTGIRASYETVRQVLKAGEIVLSRPQQKVRSPDPEYLGKKTTAGIFSGRVSRKSDQLSNAHEVGNEISSNKAMSIPASSLYSPLLR